MRIERSGGVNSLTPRLKVFLESCLGAVSQDDIGLEQEKRPDFLLLQGWVSIELKSLESDPSFRLENLIDEYRDDPKFPIFYGSWPVESVIQNLDNPEQVRKKVIDRLGRAIENHIKSANKQLLAHTERTDYQDNGLRLLFLINENFKEYDPHIICPIIDRYLKKYSDIDACIYFSEVHTAIVEGVVSFPIAVVTNAKAEGSEKLNYLDIIMEKWSEFNNAGSVFISSDRLPEFIAIEDIPNEMSRSSKWQLEPRTVTLVHTLLP